MPVFPTQSAHRILRRANQAAQENQLPGSVTIGGIAFACSLSIGPFEPKLLDDGINYRNGQDVKFTIDKSNLPAAPAPRSDVTIEGIVYRLIHSGQQTPTATAWHFVARRFA